MICPNFRGIVAGVGGKAQCEIHSFFQKKQNKKVVKQNLRFDHVWKDVRDRYGGIAMLAGTDKSVLADMYNDEAVGWLIWMCGAFANLGVGAVALCSLAAKKPEVLKTLNTYVKALGLPCTLR